MRVSMLAPGEDPTQNRKPIKGPSLSGCLLKASIISSVILGGIWLFFQSQAPVPVALAPTLTDTTRPTISPTYNRTWTPEPENTRRPTVISTPAPTLTGTQTLTPEWYMCDGQLMPMWCYTISDFPQYEPTYAMAMYQTQVAPLTPTATRTRVPIRTSTPRAVVRRTGGGSGSSGSSRSNAPAQPAPNRAAPTAYATYWLPPVPATDSPTSAPVLPAYCVPGSTWADWGTATPYVITLTPRAECLGTPMVETFTPTPTGTLSSSGIILPDGMK